MALWQRIERHVRIERNERIEWHERIEHIERHERNDGRMNGMESEQQVPFL